MPRALPELADFDRRPGNSELASRRASFTRIRVARVARFNVSRSVSFVIGLFLLSTVGRSFAKGAEVTSRLRSEVDSAIAKVKPALVRIHVVSGEYNEGREVKLQAVGSGAIISQDGYLITNHHVAGHG